MKPLAFTFGLVVFGTSFCQAGHLGGYMVVRGDCGGAAIMEQVKTVSAESSNVVCVSLGTYGAGILVDTKGRIRAWGHSYSNYNPELNQLAGITAVAAGGSGCVALRSNGTVAAFNDLSGSTLHETHTNQDAKLAMVFNNSRSSMLSELAAPRDLTNVVAISSSAHFSLRCAVLSRDGQVVGWGSGHGRVQPAEISAISLAPNFHGANLALRKDGTVLKWNSGQIPELVPGLSNIVAISAGAVHSLALGSNGCVVAWGYNGNGETSVPEGLSNVIAIAAGGFANPGMRGAGFSLALKSDGTVVGWGRKYGDSEMFPSRLKDVIGIAAGDSFWVAITTNRAVAEMLRE